MPSPFPGMDPYLERPSLWPGLHVVLINHIQADLNRRLLPNFIAEIETRVYVVRDDDPSRRFFIPDVTVAKRPKGKRSRATTAVLEIDEPIVFSWAFDQQIEEARIEIQDRRRNRLVSVIEIVSPTNKVRGSEGRESFLAKRREIMASDVSWLEVDLLRDGERSVAALSPPTDYWIIQSRAEDRKRHQGWAVNLRERLPVVGVPLGPGEPDAPLDLGAILNSAYDQGGYRYLIDYSASPEPPLDSDDAKWAHALLRKRGVRR